MNSDYILRRDLAEALLPRPLESLLEVSAVSFLRFPPALFPLLAWAGTHSSSSSSTLPLFLAFWDWAGAHSSSSLPLFLSLSSSVPTRFFLSYKKKMEKSLRSKCSIQPYKKMNFKHKTSYIYAFITYILSLKFM